MKAIIMLCAAVLAVGCTRTRAPEATAPAQAQAAEDEAGLAAALSGRIAGPPQDCISEVDLGGTKSYGRGVIVFRGGANDVIYVNRPAGGCPDLSAGRALKTQTPSTRLCRGDNVTVFDPLGGIAYGSCSLGVFTPYTRAR